MLQIFFCLIKLRAYFKDIKPKSNTDQENQPVQIKDKKKKWAPKDNHYIYWFSIKWPKQRKNEKSKTQSIQKGTKSHGRTCKKKGCYCNQCKEMWCCSNNGCRKIHINKANHQLSEHTSEISCFVELHLQLLVKEIPSYIKDTNDFMNEINNLCSTKLTTCHNRYQVTIHKCS